MKKLLILTAALLLTTAVYAETDKDLNISIGENSTITLNIGLDKWKDDSLKTGMDFNVISRTVAGASQQVLDGKVYFGKKLMSDEGMSMDFRVGYGINVANSATGTSLGYAPVIGTQINFGRLDCKFLCSIYSDGLAIPYTIGYKVSSMLVGLQGIFGINLSGTMSTSYELGVCVGF